MPDISVGEIERFLVDEAALLDEWRLEEWLALFAEVHGNRVGGVNFEKMVDTAREWGAIQTMTQELRD